MDIGIEINQYTIVEHVGRGGMADVWSARDRRLNRTVAIKTIARDLATDTNPVELFEREAQTIARLEHPHILPVYDFGEFAGRLYIAMRYVTGGSLESQVAHGPLTIEEALRVGRSVGAALDYAHRNQVIHLDIKPSNILLDSSQMPYLADFGLATMVGPEGRAANPGYGTLLYMAPEQLTQHELDYRADIYSFTILMYHLLTGELPFDATTSLALKQLQFQEDLPDLGEVSPALPVALTPVLRRGTALNPDMRPASVRVLVDELERALVPQTPTPITTGEVLVVDQGDNLPDPSTVKLDEVGALQTPDDMARQEAIDLYKRARRAWAHGQGRFLLGISHFMLISDYYIRAEDHGLELDEAGRQMLLRGALEYDHEVAHWWDQLDDANRRWVALHAIRSDNAPARVRAIYRLETLPDSQPPRIAAGVAQALQVEQNTAAQIAALHVLAQRAPSVGWRDMAYTDDIDELVAATALDWDEPEVAEQAARTVARMRSLHALTHIAQKQVAGQKGALRTLALIRDEVPNLPSVVSSQARLYAWLTNTWRRLSAEPMGIVWRFVFAFLGGFAGMSLYAYINLAGPAVLINEVLGRTISTGITFGVFVGFVVVLAGEIPARLRGFWPIWGRLLIGAALGTLAGALIWTVYAWLLLYLALPTLDGGVLLLGGLGTALGFVLAGTFRLRGWLAALLTTLVLYGFIRFAYDQAFSGNLSAPFLYFSSPEDVLAQGLMLAAFIAVGGFARALWQDARQMLAGRSSSAAVG